MMRNGAVLDTGFLITLVDANRGAHEHAKAYYRYFLENGITLYLPTVVASEFFIKQPIEEFKLLHNFKLLPFNFAEAIRCANLNSSYYRNKTGAGQRDAVKDDFKIIAQAEEQDAMFLLTEDTNSMSVYCDLLRNESKIDFKVIELSKGFDISFVNGDGQTEMSYPSDD